MKKKYLLTTTLCFSLSAPLSSQAFLGESYSSYTTDRVAILAPMVLTIGKIIFDPSTQLHGPMIHGNHVLSKTPFWAAPPQDGGDGEGGKSGTNSPQGSQSTDEISSSAGTSPRGSAHGDDNDDNDDGNNRKNNPASTCAGASDPSMKKKKEEELKNLITILQERLRTQTDIPESLQSRINALSYEVDRLLSNRPDLDRYNTNLSSLIERAETLTAGPLHKQLARQ